jgi:hypothetical protein
MTRIPGVAALPGGGSCATTLQHTPFPTDDRSFMCASSCRARATESPTTFGTTPYTARETTSLTL